MNFCRLFILSLLVYSHVSMAQSKQKSILIKDSKGNYKKTKVTESLAKNRKPDANIMEQSLTDIQAITKAFSDYEGSFIQLIRKMPNDTYKVDIMTVAGHCIGHRVQVVENKGKKNILFLARRYDCDPSLERTPQNKSKKNNTKARLKK